eukprot:TRINITY_DN1864_c0_g1_i1.p2 TRINITY_DN1864_c0_g1~~TRINITY_DN1864_c0_g1_i1.p2  ORF type:complete len:88 (-),score=5.80 TRINITY_DN1864_c0_g1_i1:72-335(-)
MRQEINQLTATEPIFFPVVANAFIVGGTFAISMRYGKLAAARNTVLAAFATDVCLLYPSHAQYWMPNRVYMVPSTSPQESETPKQNE